jgi:hypothetical protein
MAGHHSLHRTRYLVFIEYPTNSLMWLTPLLAMQEMLDVFLQSVLARRRMQESLQLVTNLPLLLSWVQCVMVFINTFFGAQSEMLQLPLPVWSLPIPRCFVKDCGTRRQASITEWLLKLCSTCKNNRKARVPQARSRVPLRRCSPSQGPAPWAYILRQGSRV